MRIVFNTDQIYKHGGIEKVMATKVNFLVNQPDIEVYIVTTEQNNLPPCYAIDNKVQLVDLFINYNRSKSYLALENLKKAILHFRRQRKLYKKIQPDVIISPNYNFDHFWLPFILEKKTKLLKEIHNSRFLEPNQRKQKGFLNKWYWELQDWIEMKYHKVVVLNKDEASYRPYKNVVVLPNPVDAFKGEALLDKKQVMAAGRIAPVKSFDDLIKAWQIVHEKCPDWELHIYGDSYGKTIHELQKLIVSLNLEKVVQIISSVEDLTETMLDYSIFALSSETECFPTVLLEALSVGVPVVSYDCPNGPRHIITNNEDGLLVETRNPEALAKGLLVIIENEEKRKQMGNKAKKNSKRFHTINVMNQWLQVLKNL